MLFTKSKMVKLLLLNILAKESENDNENWWNNPFSRISLLSMYDQIDNVKWLKLFPFFISFRLDIENRRRISALKSRKDKLKKLIAYFSKPKHISIFGRLLWFAYRSSDKLKKVAK